METFCPHACGGTVVVDCEARPAAVEEDFDEAWFSFGRGSRAVLCLKLVLELVLISEEEAAEEGHPAAEERLAEPSFGA